MKTHTRSSETDTASHLPRLLTTAEVADLLRTTRKAVWSMVERGQLPGVVRIGRRVLINRAAMVEWLAARSLTSLSER
jgi:excisionase family DNA binding protein